MLQHLVHYFSGKRVGQVAYLHRNGRYVYYLVTKQYYYQKPNYEDLRESLVELSTLCRVHRVKELAMPRIGCGLDGLQWPKVRSMLEEVFAHTGVHITVYSF